MFLWVRLVLDSLEEIYRPEDLRKTVDDLPSDLETLYDRILDRLCHSRALQSYGGVSRIFSWICSAERPLHKEELLQGIAVTHTGTESDAQSTPLGALLDHCKPFIEERPDASLAFVHFSVKEYDYLHLSSSVFNIAQVLFEIKVNKSHFSIARAIRSCYGVQLHSHARARSLLLGSVSCSDSCQYHRRKLPTSALRWGVLD